MFATKSLLPKILGKYYFDYPLAKLNWFRTGGKAEILYKPFDLADLIYFLQHKDQDIPFTIIGMGSNILVRDKGIRGIVIRLGSAISNIKYVGNKIIADSGALCQNVANFARDHSCANFEFLSGIPGSIGGALFMNAGCFGGDISQILDSALLIDSKGIIHNMAVAELKYTYRSSSLPKDYIFLRAIFNTQKGDTIKIVSKMKDIAQQRRENQPTGVACCGSVFTNPEGHSAWKLIQDSDCYNLRIGGAKISEKHSNFIINTGNATSTELEQLISEIQNRVFTKTGIRLVSEVKIIGTK